MSEIRTSVNRTRKCLDFGIVRISDVRISAFHCNAFRAKGSRFFIFFQYTLRRETHLTSLQQKEEEMRQKFVIRVKEKEGELKEAEREVNLYTWKCYYRFMYCLIMYYLYKYSRSRGWLAQSGERWLSNPAIRVRFSAKPNAKSKNT